MKYIPTEYKVVRVREATTTESLTLDNAEFVARYWRENIATSDWYDPCKEAVVVVAMSVRKKAIGHNLVSLGSLDSSIIHPREVFRPLIVMAASCFVLLHNHPSGNSSPSEEDVKATRILREAGKLLKIELLDHVIMGDKYTSLREIGYLY